MCQPFTGKVEYSIQCKGFAHFESAIFIPFYCMHILGIGAALQLAYQYTAMLWEFMYKYRLKYYNNKP